MKANLNRPVTGIPAPEDVLVGTFGVAALKIEGATIPVDAGSGSGRSGPASDWMELPIPRKMSRKAIHAMVDRWIDGGRGRDGA